jgi:HD-GYP domain-containing protein (c-di-GMP phosphodiesterase class II)
MVSYSRVEEKLDNLFDNIRNGNHIEVDEVFYEMEGFAVEVSRERDILTQLRLLHKKDDYTFNHSISVSILAISLGKWARFTKDEIFDLSIAGLFHDIGKLRVPDNIINKPGQLTPEEYNIVKKHSLYSHEILVQTEKFNEDVLLGVLHHHEKLNGLGYPNNLKGDEIHPYAKVITICDIYDALVSQRTYKERENPLKVADYIKGESFNSLDPLLSHIFLDNISRFYVGNKVLLSNGETGKIVYIHPQDKTKVIVKIGENFINFFNPQGVEIVDIII